MLLGADLSLVGSALHGANQAGSLERLGAPFLPQCGDFAEGGRFVFYNQFTSAVFSAMNELARVAQQGPT
jgi:hypothetical protein